MPNLKSFACPTCNAPLTVTGDETEVRCQFCGNMVIVPLELRTPTVPTPEQTPQSINVVLGSVNNMQPVSTSSTGCGLLWLFILIFGVIAAVAAGLIGLVTSQTVSQVNSARSTAVSALPTATSAVSLVITFGGEGTGVGMFSDPTNLAVDGKGYVYVSDRDTGLIQRFDPDGHYLSQWQAEPKAEYGPTCLAADHAGNVYACGNAGLLKFDGATGKLLATFTGDGDQRDYFRSGAAALLDGSVLVYESASDKIFKLDTNGKVLSRTDKISDHLPKGKTTFNVEIAADGLGNSFVLETGTYYILAYKPDGTFVTRFGGQGQGRAIDPSRPDQLWSTLTIAVDNQSRIYAEDIVTYEVLKVFDHDGHYLTSYPLPSAQKFVSVLHMGFDDAGDLYALGTDKKIYKFGFAFNR